VDIWDGPNSEPIIFHGRTLTSKITFRDAIAAINKYAFVASDFPLILSFETHCGVEQQGVMAKILVEILGDSLLSAPLDDIPDSQLPPPCKLMKKILIKGKVFDEENVDSDEERSNRGSGMA
jgi:hypothetical protein